MNTNNWFTVEQLDPDTFAISEYHHWEQPHCYLLCGAEKALLIDTGLGVGNIRKIIEALTPLPVMVVTTHAHWDHIGGHRQFERIAVHEAEETWLAGSFPLSLQMVKENLTYMPCTFPDDFSLDSYEIYHNGATDTFCDGDCFDLGNRQLTVLHTPGHSPGHCCFYEADRKYLYSGDLIYSGCLDAFYPTTDPELFYQSIQKIQKFQIKRIFPGHHQLNISSAIIEDIVQAFHKLSHERNLVQGSGIFDFGEFQIHI